MYVFGKIQQAPPPLFLRHRGLALKASCFDGQAGRRGADRTGNSSSI